MSRHQRLLLVAEFVNFHNMKLLPKNKAKKYSAGTMPRRGYNYTLSLCKKIASI